ncbi:MAG TPA: PASTA domain-containing protein [Thioalkalivibrio sp.]|nr:PASTA domain-containing protein [Thioalkalivibrio sp.]
MTATVPDLGGLTKAAATTQLEAAGLKLGNVTAEVNASATAGTVLRQTPSAGTTLPREASVSVVLAKAEPVAPGIHKQGSFSVRQTWHGDLDTGAETNNGSDFWFRAETATRRYLAPENGATFRVMGANQPDYFACKDASLSAGVIDVTRLRAGTWVCARTSEGRYAAFAFTAEIGASPGVMRIRYMTWKKPFVITPLPLQPGVIHIPSQ